MIKFTEYSEDHTFPSGDAGSAACHVSWPSCHGSGRVVGPSPMAGSTWDEGKAITGDAKHYVSLHSLPGNPLSLRLLEVP